MHPSSKQSEEVTNSDENSKKMSFANELMNRNNSWMVGKSNEGTDRSISFRDVNESVNMHRLPSLHQSAIESIYRNVGTENTDIIKKSIHYNILNDFFQNISEEDIRKGFKFTQIGNIELSSSSEDEEEEKKVKKSFKKK